MGYQDRRRERDKERVRERDRDREKEREITSVCLLLCCLAENWMEEGKLQCRCPHSVHLSELRDSKHKYN